MAESIIPIDAENVRRLKFLFEAAKLLSKRFSAEH